MTDLPESLNDWFGHDVVNHLDAYTLKHFLSWLNAYDNFYEARELLSDFLDNYNMLGRISDE